MRTLIRNARLVLPGGIRAGSMLMEDEKILDLDPSGNASVQRILEAEGAYLLPGLIDFHVHLDDRIGRFQLADDWRSGSEAALRNGITSLFNFVTQGKDEGLGAALERAQAKAKLGSLCDYGFHLTPTRWDDATLGEVDALLAQGFRSLKFYTTYKQAGIFSSYEQLERAFQRWSEALFLVHCEDDGIMESVDGSVLDLASASAHAQLRPEAAEIEAIRRVVELAQQTGVRLHVVHVSSLEGLEYVATHRSTCSLSGETCPQYLWLSEEDLARPDGHRYICSPPLRGQREAFRQRVREGALDAWVTDHCAFKKTDKDDWDHRDHRQVPNGLAGLGSLSHLAFRLFSDETQALQAMVRHMSEHPARLLGLFPRKGCLAPGSDADFMLLDAQGPQHPLRSSLQAVHESYEGFTSPLRFKAVFRRGEQVVTEDILAAESGPGKPLQGSILPA